LGGRKEKDGSRRGRYLLGRRAGEVEQCLEEVFSSLQEGRKSTCTEAVSLLDVKLVIPPSLPKEEEKEETKEEEEDERERTDFVELRGLEVLLKDEKEKVV